MRRDRVARIISLRVPVAGANDSIVGGSGSNSFNAGAGSDTFTGGGSGGDTFWFLASNTDGSHDYIVNFASNDVVNLFGYNEAASTTSVVNGSTTLTLSDDTQITFVNVTNITNNIHYG